MLNRLLLTLAVIVTASTAHAHGDHITMPVLKRGR
jgi:hypothetical protein